MAAGGRRPAAHGGARFRRRAQARRHLENLSPRQPGERLDPRGGDVLDRDAVHAGDEQPRPLQAGRAAEQPGLHRPGSGHQLVLEPGPYRAHVQAARRREMARRQAVHVERREMHLRHAQGTLECQAPQEPAEELVRQRHRGHDQRRSRGELPPQAAAAGAAGAARFGLFADLSLPRLAGRHAHAPDRHRPIQVRRVQAQ